MVHDNLDKAKTQHIEVVLREKKTHQPFNIVYFHKIEKEIPIV